MGFMFAFVGELLLDAAEGFDTDSESDSLVTSSDGVHNLVKKLLINNPEKVRKIATDLVSLGKDYEDVGGL